jgi:hypothetical protein
MAIAKDASTPVPFTQSGNPISGAGGTSVSFSPPANSLLVVCVSECEAYSVTNTITDSKGGSYANPVHYSAGLFGTHGAVDIFTRYLSSAPGNMTINVTPTYSGSMSMYFFKILVLTGCNSSQSGVASGTSNGSSTSAEVTLTPNFNGSWVVGVCDINTATTLVRTPVANFTEIDWFASTQGGFNYDGGDGAYEGGTTAGVAGTIGWTFNKSGPNSTGALEIAVGGTPKTVSLTTARVNVAAIAPVVTIGGLTVPLTTAQVNVAALAPTVTATRITSGGSGTSGNIKITYISPNTQALTYSIAPTPGFDPYGNQVPAGYQGPISVQQPGTQPVTTETWHSLALTGASASGNGVNGFWYRYRSDNEVELMWDITLTAGVSNICTLPAGYQPTVQQNIQSSWYGSGPGAYSSTFTPHLLVFAGTGVIQVENCNSTTISLCGRAKITLDTP